MLFSLGGCGTPSDQPDLGYVKGKVTIDGSPLSGVIVSFIPDKGRPANGTTNEDGEYEVIYLDGYKGAKLGPNTIGFFVPTGGSPSHPIPKKYQEKSEFKVEVKKGTNTFDFDLKNEPEPPKPARKPRPNLD